MAEPIVEETFTTVSRLRFRCPHCGSHMKVRTSKTHLVDYRELYFHCSNEFECGYRCKGRVTLDETLAFSYCPKAGVNIKPSPFMKRKWKLEEQGQIPLIESQSPIRRYPHERNAH
ncbi:ogr/Delta-like zinc finger family protein [Vreelandella venusta]